MKLLDIVNGAWALEAQNLIEIQGIYKTHLRGEKIDVAGVEARLGRPLANEQKKYTVREGGVGVLAIEGVLAPKANLFTEISGGASTQMLSAQVQGMLNDNAVKSIILAIDSPGGSVFGTPEFADVVRSAAKIKPIVAVSDASICSGAYWIGSACNAVYITSPMVNVGSIGVVQRRTYQPAREGGPVVEEITAGKYKRVGSPDKPLNKEDRAYVEGQLDHMYGVFISAVAQNRGVSVEQVIEHMADGRVFIGQQAIDRGLVDGFSTVDAMVEQLATNPSQFANRRKAKFAMGGQTSKPAGAQALTKPAAQAAITTEPVSLTPVINSKESTMDMKDLKEQHPALFAQIETENAAAVAAATVAGATAEAARISGVRATALPGHEKLVETLAFDGKTTPAEAALAVNAAHRASITAAAAAHAADAPKALPHAAAPSDKAKSRTEMTAEASAYAKEHGVGILDAVKALGFAV
jgi:signal peptide peptidase SppA